VSATDRRADLSALDLDILWNAIEQEVPLLSKRVREILR
jgi:hypothetical protein